MKYILFSIPCFLFLFTIVCKLAWPEWYIRQYYKGVSKHGIRNHELRSSWPSLLLASCIFLAYPYLVFPILWIIFALFVLIIPIFFFLRKSADRDMQHRFENPSDDLICIGIKKKRKQSVLNIAVLITWLYSWKHIFT